MALNHKQIKIHPERLSKIKPFIDQYNWKEAKFPSHRKDWKKFELNNKSIALNILHVPYNIEGIRHAYKSKHNLKRENHYLAVKNLSALLRGITSKHKGEFY